MSQNGQQEPECRGRPAVQGEARMARHARQQSACALAGESRRRKRARGAQAPNGESRHQERMIGKMRGRQDLPQKVKILVEERLECAHVWTRVHSKSFCSALDTSMKNHGIFAGQSVGQREFRLGPFDSKIPEWDGLQKRRAQSKRMNRRTDVVNEAGNSELGGTRSSTYGISCFKNRDRTSGSRQLDRRR